MMVIYPYTKPLRQPYTIYPYAEITYGHMPTTENIPNSPLINTISTRDIHRAGFVLQTKLSDLIHDNTWMWPTEWLNKYPNLSTINVPMLNFD